MSKRRQEGYLLIDHRESPGVPESMVHVDGKYFPPALKGKTFECATVTCAHCNVVVFLNPNRTRARGYCQKCDAYVCDQAGCALECRSFVKLLDTLQEQAFQSLTLTKE